MFRLYNRPIVVAFPIFSSPCGGTSTPWANRTNQDVNKDEWSLEHGNDDDEVFFHQDASSLLPQC
jgi:hypothetical protein